VSKWPSSKANRVYRALLRIGWSPKTHKGCSHITLQRAGHADFVWAFHEGVEIGPKMLARIAKHTGLKAEGLSWPSPPFHKVREGMGHQANAASSKLLGLFEIRGDSFYQFGCVV
jgi:predicted RNA binding protein YcfA (HicA-like mRNA interferase family)